MPGRIAVLIEAKTGRGVSGLPELRLLSEAAGYDVVREFHQSRRIDSSFCIGKGKAEEIAKEVKTLGFPVKVIINNRLKPSQHYNLTKLLENEVIDRFQLILEIFTKRAGTIEAKYQIELAKLQYELPMARENVKLARMGELPGFHGLGKYQADVYSLMIKRRISYLQSKLVEISKRKSINRLRRKEEALFTVALTGYTFAGKTTLFNRLTQELLPVGEGLFTTLSTTTRAVSVSQRKVLLSDTVGFIDNLPHLLVESFFSTLEEVTLADKVLLVLDSSDTPAEFSRKLHTCISTLNEIGVFSNSIIPLLNKIDLSNDPTSLEDLTLEIFGAMPLRVSARTGEGIQGVLEALSNTLPKYESIQIIVPISQNASSLIAWAFKEASVKSLGYDDHFLKLELEINPAFLPRLRIFLRDMDGVTCRLGKEA
jgi:GTP-binding protein HflX